MVIKLVLNHKYPLMGLETFPSSRFDLDMVMKRLEKVMNFR